MIRDALAQKPGTVQNARGVHAVDGRWDGATRLISKTGATTAADGQAVSWLVGRTLRWRPVLRVCERRVEERRCRRARRARDSRFAPSSSEADPSLTDQELCLRPSRVLLCGSRYPCCRTVSRPSRGTKSVARNPFMAYDALVTYLNDHLGGSNAALQLLEHMSARETGEKRSFYAGLLQDVTDGPRDARGHHPPRRRRRARSVRWAAGSPRRRIG